MASGCVTGLRAAGISAWFVLRRTRCSCLQVVPERIEWTLMPSDWTRICFYGRFEENQALLECAEVVELSAGDVLLFHCRLFHAAANTFDAVKLSKVFTTIKMTIVRNRIRAQIAFPVLMWSVLTRINSPKLELITRSRTFAMPHDREKIPERP